MTPLGCGGSEPRPPQWGSALRAPVWTTTVAVVFRKEHPRQKQGHIGASSPPKDSTRSSSPFPQLVTINLCLGLWSPGLFSSLLCPLLTPHLIWFTLISQDVDLGPVFPGYLVFFHCPSPCNLSLQLECGPGPYLRTVCLMPRRCYWILVEWMSE